MKHTGSPRNTKKGYMNKLVKAKVKLIHKKPKTHTSPRPGHK